jgi:tRNA nucleotidyltransferase (CCA-adding enzyme)
MKKIMNKFRPHAIQIQDAGGELYLVGGSVRDFMLRRPSHDHDFCVTGLTVEQFTTLFPEARIQGKDFPVFVIDGCEFALARTEKKCGIGYKGFEINANPSINSMAVEVLHGNLIDPFNGARDLVNKMIRPTSCAFLEDPVRALRAARFAAELDFNVSSWIYTYIWRLKSELKSINKNMKFNEMRKALSGKAPARFFEVLRLSGVLDVVIPELANLDGVPQAHHDDGDSYEHTMTALAKCRELTSDPVILNGVLWHDVGKGTTPVEEWPAHHDHETRSKEIIESIDWMPNEYKSFAGAFAIDHMRAHRYLEMRKGRKVSLIERVNKCNRGLDGFCTALYSDKPTAETMEIMIRMQTDYAKIMAVTGKDVPEHIPKNEQFGQVLHQMRAGLIA